MISEEKGKKIYLAENSELCPLEALENKSSFYLTIIPDKTYQYPTGWSIMLTWMEANTLGQLMKTAMAMSGIESRQISNNYFASGQSQYKIQI